MIEERGREHSGPGSPPSKICSRCAQFKSVAEFHRKRSRKDGRAAYCKACAIADAAARRAARRAAPEYRDGDKRCCKCKQVKPVVDFPKDASAAGGYGSTCNTCAREITRQWQAQNPERVKEHNARWYAKNAEYRREYMARWEAENRERQLEYKRKRYRENPEVRAAAQARRHRRRAASGEITGAEWLALREFYKVCLCCGCDGPLTLDHVVPLFVGGENTIENAQPLCKPCNSRKGIKTIDYRDPERHAEFIKMLPRLSLF